jgi:hypothetical protein
MDAYMPSSKRAKIAPGFSFAPVKEEPDFSFSMDPVNDFLFQPDFKMDPMDTVPQSDPEPGAQLSQVSAPAPVSASKSIPSHAPSTLEVRGALLIKDIAFIIMANVWKASLVDSISLGRVCRFFGEVYREMFLEETLKVRTGSAFFLTATAKEEVSFSTICHRMTVTVRFSMARTLRF